ncbi:hypothetical protein GQ55_7G110600 [Panicum hallii var. hallii]|uniref:Knottin scorpion toxin-like domain-containing protein n=1 Tax=Panicum hallii var. hallii TaxID=1504633 RepID=A0A2T7CTY8_9POAL|nr:hypothetical protein GQ55_7G110600 [Panicum hallii var. hallii]
MAVKTVVLAILLVVSLVFADVVVKGQQLGGSEGPELVDSGSGDDGGGNRVSPKSECSESKLYTGPCVEMVCLAACMLQMHHGGHCKGSFFWGGCHCFACS